MKKDKWVWMRCKRCGKCCMEEPCLVSEAFIKKFPCPALKKNEDDTHTCDMMVHPSLYTNAFGPGSAEMDLFLSSLVKKVLAEGEGCGAGYNTKFTVKIDKLVLSGDGFDGVYK